MDQQIINKTLEDYNFDIDATINKLQELNLGSFEEKHHHPRVNSVDCLVIDHQQHNINNTNQEVEKTKKQVGKLVNENYVLKRLLAMQLDRRNKGVDKMRSVISEYEENILGQFLGFPSPENLEITFNLKINNIRSIVLIA